MPDVQTRRWKRVEYERMIECGIFQPDERLELIGGVLVVREPQSSPHMAAIRLAQEALRVAFGPGWDVRPQGPVALDDDSEPEPDVSVVPGSPRDYVEAHPARPALVVEISLASLAFDRAEKSSLYARAGIADYWIVNLVDRVVEVRRTPIRAETAAYGWTYASLDVAGPDDSLAALAAPGALIPVRDLLP
ncbi:MAG: Uma2 family endonuclease [Candidatus Rokubacteria bacterium]|nr:Uma2 family endonuclease [Candidatus Rokubacteria bacterium]